MGPIQPGTDSGTRGTMAAVAAALGAVTGPGAAAAAGVVAGAEPGSEDRERDNKGGQGSGGHGDLRPQWHRNSALAAHVRVGAGPLVLLCLLISTAMTLVSWAVDSQQLESEALPAPAYSASGAPQVCDYSQGQWVRDLRYPLYDGRQCAWPDKKWACKQVLDRPSFDYENYRWQPTGCDLPPFNATDFLERLRNKVVAFVGDSLSLQQFQSLLCMLDPNGPEGEGGEAPDLPARNRTGAPIDIGKAYGFYWIPDKGRPSGWAYRFPASNTTVLCQWNPFLCQLEPIDAANATQGSRMHLDRPDKILQTQLPHIGLLVLNTGHYWNWRHMRNNSFYVNGTRVFMHKTKGAPQGALTIGRAHDLTVASVLQWADSQLQAIGKSDRGRNGGRRGRPEQLVLLRTRSSEHFYGGEWNSGGGCHNIHSLLREEQLGNLTLRRDPQLEAAVAGVPVHKGQRYAIGLLNISQLTSYRGDAHPSLWWSSTVGNTSNKMQDCLHWCLPGGGDVWNEIMYAKLVAHQERLASGHQASMRRQ